jgi:membrane protease YdiL (CAAX protease family)
LRTILVTLNVTDGTQNKLKILLVLAVGIAFSSALKHYVGVLGVVWYRAVSLAVAAVAIGLMLHLMNWKVPTKSKMRPIPSLLFIFGAFMLGQIFLKAWADFMGSMSPAFQSPEAFGDVPDAVAVSTISIVMSVVIAPIREEFLYRLGLLGTLRSFVKPPVALLISAAVFTLAHAWSHPYVALVPIAVTGLILGLAYLALGFPWAVALHIWMNLQPLLSANGFQAFLLSDYFFPIYLALTGAGVWVFITRLVRNRKTIFGSDTASQH